MGGLYGDGGGGIREAGALRALGKDILAGTDHSEHLNAVGEDLVQDPKSLFQYLAKVLHLKFWNHAPGSREIGDLIRPRDDGICKAQRRILRPSPSASNKCLDVSHRSWLPDDDQGVMPSRRRSSADVIPRPAALS